MKRKRKHTLKTLGIVLVFVAIAVAIGLLVWGTNVAVLDPAGGIAERQRELIFFASLLSLVVVVPVFALTFFIAWKYRASNKKAKYMPDWDHHVGIETLWWGIPFALIIILSVVAFKTSHELDPFKPLESDKKPLTVQVVALQWKWLFIYPEYDIATVNYVHIPEDRPIEFQVTSDAPMNSFWIPQLGGQIYAMSGMSTKLYLIANETGTYRGTSANISGEGFADMVFSVKATTQAEFDEWIKDIKDYNEDDVGKIEATLGLTMYNDNLHPPGIEETPRTFRLVDPTLYDTIVTKHGSHGGAHKDTDHHTEGQ